MRRYQWMALLVSVLVIGSSARPAVAQPGHAPFVYAPFEVDDFERTLAPAGIAGATMVSPAFVGDTRVTLFDHPAVTANGGNAAPYVTGAPLFLEETHSAWEQWGGILGHTGAGTHATTTNYNDLFPGGWSMSPGGYPTKGSGAHQPSSITDSGEDTYTGTKISLVSKTDGNTADDLAVTSGNQAMRVSLWNVGNGGDDTSFERPVMLSIKANDFWGISDSRFASWETVRANPGEYNISVDFTILANEIPDEFAPTYGPYLRLGLISGHGANFDESPADILQGPPSLLFSNGDADNDMLPNFSDSQFVDMGNTAGLPAYNAPNCAATNSCHAGIIQRRYVFPASAMQFPAAPLTGLTDLGNDENNGGSLNAYMLGFVFNGNWKITNPAALPNPEGIKGIWGNFPQYFASFIVDNMKILPRNPISSADFNGDTLLNKADWIILANNLNKATPPAATFATGDIGSLVNESLVSPGVVDFQDFVRFEEIWNANNGGNGAFQRFLAGVPEPTSFVLVILGLVPLCFRRTRSARKIGAMMLAAGIATSASSASAALTNTLLFDWEQPINTLAPELRDTQRWQAAGDAANTTTIPTVLRAASAATGGSTMGLAITQNGSGPSWDASVSIFDATDGGLPPQAQAFAAALDVGANNYVLEFDVKYIDSQVPSTSGLSLRVRLGAGAGSTDQVLGVAAVAGDGGGNIGNSTIPVSIPLSIAAINTADGVLSVPAKSSDAGFYNISVGLEDGDWGAGPATFNIDNMRLRQVTQPPLLTLQVNTTSGVATIKNTPGADAGTGPVTFDYYEISSRPNGDYNNNGVLDVADYVAYRHAMATDVLPNDPTPGVVDGSDYNLWRANFGLPGTHSSLNAAGWSSLDTQNLDALDDRGGADAGTTAGDSALEGWDKSGSPSSSILSEAFLLGGSTRADGSSIAIGNIFAAGGSHNLVFRYREPSRPSVLRTGLVTYVTSGAGGGSSVPEPGTMTLVLIGALALASGRKR